MRECELICEALRAMDGIDSVEAEVVAKCNSTSAPTKIRVLYKGTAREAFVFAALNNPRSSLLPKGCGLLVYKDHR